MWTSQLLAAATSASAHQSNQRDCSHGRTSTVGAYVENQYEKIIEILQHDLHQTGMSTALQQGVAYRQLLSY